MNEHQLREAKTPWPKTIEELTAIIKELTERQHDYGTCVYAISLASLATYNYVASALGCTGFQASFADLDMIQRTRHMENGFRIVDYGKLLYPQYLTGEHFPSMQDLLEENKDQLKKAAQKLLDEKSEHVHADVVAHWRKLAS
jgi:hypothetical protein